ncbi:hypothetical protein [Streptomyces sp. NPDC058620]|uniref:hypothetical protein n=1 Tax=Streptomyces sp. NPDC058620 TaxID=3346560 RepID=UPI003647900D
MSGAENHARRAGGRITPTQHSLGHWIIARPSGQRINRAGWVDFLSLILLPGGKIMVRIDGIAGGLRFSVSPVLLISGWEHYVRLFSVGQPGVP